MSLEQALSEQTAAIRENTKAVIALCDAWNALRDRATEIAAGKNADNVVAAKVPLSDVPKVEAKAEKKKAEAAPKAEPTPVDTPPASETAPTATADATPAAESPSEELPEPVSLQDLQAEVLAKAKVNKQAVLELLAQYGAKSASTVPEADRAAVFAAVKAL